MAPPKNTIQCPEGISELVDIREDIRNIFHVLRELSEKMSDVGRNVAVHDIQLLHLKEGFEKHLLCSEAAIARVSKLEELKYEAKGALWGMTKGTALLLTGGTAAVSAAVIKFIELWNQKP